MKKHLSSLIFAGVFLALCLFPTVGMALTGPSDTVANEPPAPAPAVKKWDGSFNADVLPDLSAWLGQRFALRQQTVTLWARLNAGVFHTSVTDSVLLGREGWLFYAPTLEDYTGSDPMSERELWCAGRTLYLLQEYARGQEADFLFAVAPNKNTLYGAYMPALPRAAAASNAERLEALLREMGVSCADLFAAFAGEEEALYFPTDSHWNGRGAALAADTILGALGRQSAFFGGSFADGTHRGDLYEMLYPAGKETDPDYLYTGFVHTADSDNPDAMTIRTESPAGTGRLLCYRDSFGRNLCPYLAEGFAQATFSRKNVYDPTSLTAGDTMVVELVERNLRYLIENTPLFPSPAWEPGARSWRQTGESVKLALAKGAPTGYTVLHGVWEGQMPDDDSPVYVAAGGRYYEAMPRPDGFFVCLPEGETSADFRVIYTVKGEWIALTGEAES